MLLNGASLHMFIFYHELILKDVAPLNSHHAAFSLKDLFHMLNVCMLSCQSLFVKHHETNSLIYLCLCCGVLFCFFSRRALTGTQLSVFPGCAALVT